MATAELRLLPTMLRVLLPRAIVSVADPVYPLAVAAPDSVAVRPFVVKDAAFVADGVLPAHPVHVAAVDHVPDAPSTQVPCALALPPSAIAPSTERAITSPKLRIDAVPAKERNPAWTAPK